MFSGVRSSISEGKMTWSCLNKTSDKDFVKAFNFGTEKKIKDLTKQLKKGKVQPNRELVFKVIDVLSERTTPPLSQRIAKKFFDQISSSHLLEAKDTSYDVASFLSWASPSLSKSDRFKKMSNGTILADLCHHAIKSSNQILAIEIAKLMLENDLTDFTIFDGDGVNILAIALSQRHMDLAKMLVDNLPNEVLQVEEICGYHKSLLYLTLEAGNEELAKTLIGRGAPLVVGPNPEYIEDLSQAYCYSPLPIALSKLELALYILENYPNSLKNGAVYEVYLSLMNLMELKIGEDKLLLFIGQFVNQLREGNHVIESSLIARLLRKALKYNRELIAIKLLCELDSKKIYINKFNSNTLSYYFYQIFKTALKKQHFNFCSKFIEGMPSNLGLERLIYDVKKYNPVHLACRYGSPTIIKQILQKKGSVTEKSGAGSTPFEFVVRRGENFYEVIPLILDKVVEQTPPEKRNEILFEYLSELMISHSPESSIEVIGRQILARLDFFDQDVSTHLNEFLMEVIVNRKNRGLPIVPDLFKAGANALAENKEGDSALSVAIAKENAPIVRTLLQYMSENTILKSLDFLEFSKDSFSVSLMFECLDVLLDRQNLYENGYFRKWVAISFSRFIEAITRYPTTSTCRPQFFENISKVLEKSEIKRVLESSLSEIFKKTEEREKEKEQEQHPTLGHLVYFLNTIGHHALGTYLSEETRKDLLNLFKKKALEGELNLEQARLLANLLPEETQVTMTLDGRGKMQGNLFILAAASPVFRKQFMYRKSSSLKILNADLKLVNIFYRAFSEGVLDYSELEPFELDELNKLIDMCELPIPQLTNRMDLNFLDQMIDKPFVISGQKEFYFNATLESIHSDLLKLEQLREILPDLEYLKVNTKNFYECFYGFPTLLRQLKISKIRVDASDFFRGLKPRRNSDKLFLDCRFWLDNLKNIPSSKIVELTNFVQGPIQGLDLSGRDSLDVRLDLDSFSQLDYLNISESNASESNFEEFIRNVPQSLRELVVRNSSLKDADLIIIGETCPHLTSVDLCENDLSSAALIDFMKRMPQLETIKISVIDEAMMELMAEIRPDLSLYNNDKLVLKKSLVDIDRLPVSELISLVLDDRYSLSKKSLHKIIKQIFQSLEKREGFHGTGEAIIKIFGLLDEKEAMHPLISYTNRLENRELVNFYILLAQAMPEYTLEQVLPSSFLNNLEKQFLQYAENHQLGLKEASSIARLLSRPPVSVSVKGSKKPFLIPELVLKCSGPFFSRFLGPVKAQVFSNRFIFKAIHSYLVDGKVNLKKNSLNTLMEICKEVEKYGLSLENFLSSAENGVIGIALKPYVLQDDIEGFANENPVVSKVTLLDVKKIDLNNVDVIPLLENAIHVSTIRIVASQRPLPESLEEVLRKKRIEIETFEPV